MEEVGESSGIIQKLIDSVNEISISDYRSTVKKLFSDLAVWLLFEEIRDIKGQLTDDSSQALLSSVEAMESAIEFLRIGTEGSKIYLTYERSSIEKWLEDVRRCRFCPVTGQILTSKTLTPNYSLKSLIETWCKENRMEPPEQPSGSAAACTLEDRSRIESLVRMLSSSPDDQRSASSEIRSLAQRDNDIRVAVVEAGAIPYLTSLLTASDTETQVHAVTALHNLSICEDNKGRIMSSGAVSGIVEVLSKGSMEARANAAATLFSLSFIDENKETIGSLGAIPPLVVLLTEGTRRGKKDAATALFNLCINQGNKGLAVRAGVVPTLMELTEPRSGMEDEALAHFGYTFEPPGRAGGDR